jgi:hypothetical protein
MFIKASLRLNLTFLTAGRKHCNHDGEYVIMIKGDFMIRTQIQLTEEQAKKLRELSATGRESVAALIRKAVDQFIVSGIPDRPALYRQAEPVVGKYKSDSSDISIHHDRYLEEDFES